MLITAIISHKAWDFTLCWSLQIWSILESNAFSNKKVRSQLTTNQLNKPESPGHIYSCRQKHSKNTTEMQSPNILKCKISTKHIYNTNVGDLFCKLSPALASSLIPPASEHPLKLRAGLKCTQQCTEAVLQGKSWRSRQQWSPGMNSRHLTVAWRKNWPQGCALVFSTDGGRATLAAL